DEDHLYTFKDGFRFTTGFGHNHTQLFFSDRWAEVWLASFDHEGNLVALQQRPVPNAEPNTRQQLEARRNEVKKAWLEELGFQPPTIKVKRFRFDNGEGISDFGRDWPRIFERPNHPERDTARNWLDRWLAHGQFAYGDRWIDRNGEVTDT